MKCPADVVIACDKEPECKCGFCKDHCICDFIPEEFNDFKKFLELNNINCKFSLNRVGNWRCKCSRNNIEKEIVITLDALEYQIENSFVLAEASKIVTEITLMELKI